MLDIVVAVEIIPEIHVTATALGNRIAHGHDARALSGRLKLQSGQVTPERVPIDPIEADIVLLSARRDGTKRTASHVGGWFRFLTACALGATANHRITDNQAAAAPLQGFE